MAVEKLGPRKAQTLKSRLNSLPRGSTRKRSASSAASSGKNRDGADTAYRVTIRNESSSKRSISNSKDNTDGYGDEQRIERASRITDLKKQIRSGSYHIETNILAESVLRAIIHDGGIKKFVDGA